MKLKSPNVWFIFGTVPVLVLDFVLGAWFARGMVWLSVVLLLLGPVSYTHLTLPTKA